MDHEPHYLRAEIFKIIEDFFLFKLSGTVSGFQLVDLKVRISLLLQNLDAGLHFHIGGSLNDFKNIELYEDQYFFFHSLNKRIKQKKTSMMMSLSLSKVLLLVIFQLMYLEKNLIGISTMLPSMANSTICKVIPSQILA